MIENKRNKVPWRIVGYLEVIRASNSAGNRQESGLATQAQHTEQSGSMCDIEQSGGPCIE